MGLFSFLQRSSRPRIGEPSDRTAPVDASSPPARCVQVLGFGDEKCDLLAAAAAEALRGLAMADSVECITDMAKIADHGIMVTPALLVDGIVVAFGRVLSVEEIAKILQKVR